MSSVRMSLAWFGLLRLSLMTCLAMAFCWLSNGHTNGCSLLHILLIQYIISSLILWPVRQARSRRVVTNKLGQPKKNNLYTNVSGIDGGMRSRRWSTISCCRHRRRSLWCRYYVFDYMCDCLLRLGGNEHAAADTRFIGHTSARTRTHRSTSQKQHFVKCATNQKWSLCVHTQLLTVWHQMEL